MTFEFDEVVFFKRLRALIRSKDEKSDVLAAKCNMPLGSFNGYLYSQNLPTAGKLAQLCHGLETTADWLLFGEPISGETAKAILKPPHQPIDGDNAL